MRRRMTGVLAAVAVAGAGMIGISASKALADPQPPPGVPVDIDYRSGVHNCNLLVNRADGRERCVQDGGVDRTTEYTDDPAAGRRWCAEDIKLNGDPPISCTVKPVREYPEYLSRDDGW